MSQCIVISSCSNIISEIVCLHDKHLSNSRTVSEETNFLFTALDGSAISTMGARLCPGFDFRYNLFRKTTFLN